jgi:hypothetical protein
LQVLATSIDMAALCASIAMPLTRRSGTPGSFTLETAVGAGKVRQVVVAPEESERRSVTYLELLRSYMNCPESRANAQFLPFGTPGNCGF